MLRKATSHWMASYMHNVCCAPMWVSITSDVLNEGVHTGCEAM